MLSPGLQLELQAQIVASDAGREPDVIELRLWLTDRRWEQIPSSVAEVLTSSYGRIASHAGSGGMCVPPAIAALSNASALLRCIAPLGE